MLTHGHERLVVKEYLAGWTNKTNSLGRQVAKIQKEGIYEIPKSEHAVVGCRSEHKSMLNLTAQLSSLLMPYFNVLTLQCSACFDKAIVHQDQFPNYQTICLLFHPQQRFCSSIFQSSLEDGWSCRLETESLLPVRLIPPAVLFNKLSCARQYCPLWSRVRPFLAHPELYGSPH